MRILSILVIAAALTGCCNSKKEAVVKHVGNMPAVEKGYEQGVSALYGAVVNDTLYIAGGCNFPETPAAEGGSKRYYKGIYKSALNDTLVWEKAGELPQASAYGINVQKGNKWYIAGGCNADGAQSGFYCITIDNIIKTDTLPSLPYTIDNAYAAISPDGVIFIAGGNADGKASCKILSFDTNNPQKGWEEIAPMPSPRVQPVCVATGEKLYVWGGFAPGDGNTARVYTDGICYDRQTGTTATLNEISINKKATTLSGGTAAQSEDGCIYAAGGVNKDIFLDAISGNYNLIAKKDYMTQEPAWYKFGDKLLKYSIAEDKWEVASKEKTFARAGALLLTYKNKLIYTGGELKPGIRTPNISIIE